MDKSQFSKIAVDLIGSSDLPLSTSLIIAKTGAAKTSAQRWLKQMVSDRVLVFNEGKYSIAAPKKEVFPMKKGDDAYVAQYRIMTGRTINICANALSHLDPIKDLSVKGYCVDLYFPDQKIAVEAARLNPDGDRFNQEFDLQRTRFITRILGCQWIIFDPSEHGFCPGKVINRVLKVVNSAIACEVA